VKITRIEIFKADLPLKRVFRIAIGEIKIAKSVFVRVHTDDGIYGVGEGNLLTQVTSETQGTALAVAQDLAKLLVGRDPLDIEGCVHDMRAYMPHCPTTRSAFDMALYDLAGKAANLPLYALLGGTKRILITDNTVGIDPTAEMVEHALEIKGRGFPAVKVKLGTTPEQDIERIRLIREAIGREISIRIDANQGWDRMGAIQALRGMESSDVQYCEQPVPAWDYESMREVRLHTNIPIMADESVFDEFDALKLIRMNACDYLNIKLAKSSGIRVAIKINAVAEAAGVKCMVGCMNETRLGLAASAHLVSAYPNIVFADLDGADMLSVDPVQGGIVYADDGQVTLPEGPGLGADFDPAFLSELESFAVE